MLVDEGEERGAIEESEKKMINSIFEFDDRDVSEVMTHRTEVAAVPVNATLRGGRQGSRSKRDIPASRFTKRISIRSAASSMPRI